MRFESSSEVPLARRVAVLPISVGDKRPRSSEQTTRSMPGAVASRAFIGGRRTAVRF